MWKVFHLEELYITSYHVEMEAMGFLDIIYNGKVS